MPDYRARPRPPRLAGPLVEALSATGLTRAQQARAIGISRAQIQDRLSGRRGARGWTDQQLRRLAELLGMATAEARRLLDEQRDIAVTVDVADHIAVCDDGAPDRDSNVAVCESCKSGGGSDVCDDCGVLAAT